MKESDHEEGRTDTSAGGQSNPTDLSPVFIGPNLPTYSTWNWNSTGNVCAQSRIGAPPLADPINSSALEECFLTLPPWTPHGRASHQVSARDRFDPTPHERRSWPAATKGRSVASRPVKERLSVTPPLIHNLDSCKGYSYCT
ncbi:hypothetical protein Zmor_014841 [Zophobas morio]|uniref:Uncharacterized protein n=1 Tax=Zophobas morio TaxID=2755281 RepID=A0AA38IKB7_9CUCU|nr:hypothetical protein Zmor_014841 [Zophobas morio]